LIPKVGLLGESTTESRLGGPTVRTSVPFTVPFVASVYVAVILAVPAVAPVARPDVAEIVALLESEVHVTAVVRSFVVLSL
jgi:hypothetical protein